MAPQTWSLTFELVGAQELHVPSYQNLVFLQVARCTKIINPGTDEAKYVINVKQIAKVGDCNMSTKCTLC